MALRTLERNVFAGERVGRFRVIKLQSLRSMTRFAVRAELAQMNVPVTSGTGRR